MDEGQESGTPITSANSPKTKDSSKITESMHPNDRTLFNLLCKHYKVIFISTFDDCSRHDGQSFGTNKFCNGQNRVIECHRSIERGL